MLISGGRRPRPTSKKNRHSVLTEASGCSLVAFFLTRPPFLIGCVIWKRLLFAFIFSTISHYMGIVGYFYLAAKFK